MIQSRSCVQARYDQKCEYARYLTIWLTGNAGQRASKKSGNCIDSAQAYIRPGPSWKRTLIARARSTCQARKERGRGRRCVGCVRDWLSYQLSLSVRSDRGIGSFKLLASSYRTFCEEVRSCDDGCVYQKRRVYSKIAHNAADN